MKADLILYNAFVEPGEGDTVSDGAVVILDGKIIDVGGTADIINKYDGIGIRKVDCKGQFLMPGFIEGHGHFSGLGFNLLQLDLLNTTTWQEIMDSVEQRVRKTKPGIWITGRGWHQEKWKTAIQPAVDGYPYHYALSAISPDNPVMLLHASGHSLIANEAGMKAAGIGVETPDPKGGKIIRDHQGTAIGIFEENAMDIIESAYKAYQNARSQAEVNEEWFRAIDEVQKHCLEHGITSFQDAGSTFTEISRYDQLAGKDSLNVRLWAMIREPLDSLKKSLSGIPILRSGKDMFTCRTIKSYMDGALGSYGAWLLEPYLERPGFKGQNVTPVEEIKEVADLCIKNGLQMAVHAIGDQANRAVLDIYEESFSANPDKKDLRWRIEHAQHIDPADIPRFNKLDVIASMQAIHCTSDAPFVEKRLGYERARSGAYVWRSLLDSGAIIANGTDAPVERIDPIQNFYASVTRKSVVGSDAFFPEQCMTRKEAIRSLTLSNAYAAFEEDIKGSIEKGKWADFVLLSNNLLTCPEDSIMQTKVLMTIVGGEVLYRETSFVIRE